MGVAMGVEMGVGLVGCCLKSVSRRVVFWQFVLKGSLDWVGLKGDLERMRDGRLGGGEVVPGGGIRL